MLGASQKISNSSGQSGPEKPAALPEAERIERVRQALSSPEGEALLRLLRADGGAGLQAAAQAMRQGDMEAVRAALTPLLEGTEAEALTQRLEERL